MFRTLAVDRIQRQQEMIAQIEGGIAYMKAALNLPIYRKDKISGIFENILADNEGVK